MRDTWCDKAGTDEGNQKSMYRSGVWESVRAIITPMLKRQQSSFLSAWAVGSIAYMADTVLNSFNLQSWSLHR